MSTLRDTLDRINQQLESIHVVQAVHTEQLKTHMKRSDALEARVEQVDQRLNSWPMKMAGVIGTILAIAVAIKEIFF